nr:MAG TPA: hypothetical protein [Bacteriophage sp.]
MLCAGCEVRLFKIIPPVEIVTGEGFDLKSSSVT